MYRGHLIERVDGRTADRLENLEGRAEEAVLLMCVARLALARQALVLHLQLHDVLMGVVGEGEVDQEVGPAARGGLRVAALEAEHDDLQLFVEARQSIKAAILVV